ncbi:MAG TPA: hypothetical protein VM121_05685 [Acidimicrobiales bacterium]|nr:hypothetical protein [Acidimicrobiales bacterium]
MSPLLVIVAVVVGLGLVGLVVGYAVVWLERRHRRSVDQAGTVRALQMSLFSVVQAAERHHDAVALNGDRLEGTTTTPADAEAEARAAAATYQSMVRDRQLKDLSDRLLESTSRLLSTTDAATAQRLQGDVELLQDRFRARSIEVVRGLRRGR